MSTKIMVYLHSPDTTDASWVTINDMGSIQQTLADNKLSDLIATAVDKEIIVIIPADDVLLTQTTLPKLNRQRLQQALPFALEEQLLTDISELHFANGEYQADGTLPVAVITKQKIEEWIAVFKQMGLSPAAIIPAPFALPLLPDNWQVIIDDSMAMVRTELYNGFTCDTQNLATLLALKLQETPQKPQRIYLRNYGQAAIPLEKIDTISIEQTLLPRQQLITDFAQHATTAHINLLQGHYQAKRQASYGKKIWLAAGYTTATWVGLILLSHLISFFILHHQASTLETSINTIYKRNFPKATAMVAPKERMLEKLNTLTHQGNRNDLLLWLGHIGKSLAQTNTVRIQQLDFHDNQLSLELSAPTFDNIDAFAQSLTQQGQHVKQQNVAAAGTQVKGTLVLSQENAS